MVGSPNGRNSLPALRLVVVENRSGLEPVLTLLPRGRMENNVQMMRCLRPGAAMYTHAPQCKTARNVGEIIAKAA